MKEHNQKPHKQVLFPFIKMFFIHQVKRAIITDEKIHVPHEMYKNILFQVIMQLSIHRSCIHNLMKKKFSAVIEWKASWVMTFLQLYKIHKFMTAFLWILKKKLFITIVMLIQLRLIFSARSNAANWVIIKSLSARFRDEL